MAFNSYAYHANRTRREAWDYLAQARALRDQLHAGDRWRSPESLREGIANRVTLARLNMQQSLTYRRLRQLQRERRGRA